MTFGLSPTPPSGGTTTTIRTKSAREQAIDALVSMLSSPNEEVRLEAARLIVEAGR